MTRRSYPCSEQQACWILYVILIWRWSQQQAGLVFGVHPGTVNHIVHRRRFPHAVPIEPIGI